MNLEYPEFRPLRYGVALENPRNRPLLCPESFFLGNVLVTPPSELELEIEKWLEFRRAEHDFEFLFDFNREFMVPTEETTKKGRKISRNRKKRLVDLTAEQLVFALRRKIHIHDRTLSIWNYHGDNAVTETNSGTQVLTGRVKSIGDARESQRTKFHLVSIDDPFAHNTLHFNNLSCTCEDCFWTSTKLGNRNAQITCLHVAAMLDFLSRHPEKIKNYDAILEELKRRNKEITDLELIVPFCTDSIDAEVLKWFRGEKHPYISKGDQPSLSNLKIDVLMARYFSSTSCFELAKILLRLPIYNEQLLDWIIDGKAGFEVLPQENVFSLDKKVADPVRRIHEAINNHLYREGFVLKGYVLEKKGSPHEVIAINYVHKSRDESVRVIFNENYPPIIVRRTPVINSRFYPFREYESQVSIFRQLYQYERTGKELRGLDDRTRRYTRVSVELPPCFIPNELLKDYKRVIEAEIPGGCDSLIKRAGRINRKQSLFYKIKNA